MDQNDLNEQQQIRRQKVQDLNNMGIDPYGKRFSRSHLALDIINTYGKLDAQKLEKKAVLVSVAGRIVLKRLQGKAGFISLQDKSAKIQIYLKLDNLNEKQFEVFKASDLGDIIGISGTLFRTKTNELTIRALNFTHLTKALSPLPDKFHGLQDKEESRRKRYLDLIVNEDSKRIAVTRPKIIRAFQTFFDSQGFIEVETPVLQPILGGATARPFVTHHNALDMPFYLRIATELPLKKLIVGGLEAVYEIGRLFRNEGMDSTHNPEFTTVEAYLAYADMTDMMKLCENCFKYVTKTILGTPKVPYGEHIIDFSKKFQKIHMVDFIKSETNVDFFNHYSLEEAIEIAKKHDIKTLKHFTVGHIIEAFFEKYCESQIIQPTFIYGHPIEISPLAKKNKKDPRFTDRFEVFICKKEFANAFSELNDPIDQRERFNEQIKQKSLGNEEASEMDIDFLEALEYGMPPTGGIGIGIDRFVMLLCNTQSIRDVLLFPHMKQK